MKIQVARPLANYFFPRPLLEKGTKGEPVRDQGRQLFEQVAASQEWHKLLEIARLRRIDQMVRAHERAHLVAGGEIVLSGPHYIYKKGPDGRLYAVGGDVRIDTSPVPGDPEATLRKAEKIIRAALAPLNPSPQDLRVAMKARMMAMAARQEIQKNSSEDRNGAFGQEGLRASHR